MKSVEGGPNLPSCFLIIGYYPVKAHNETKHNNKH
jgi:hypothetical protein